MAVGIDTPTFVEKNLPVAALTPADEKNEVVASGKGTDVWHAVGHLTADCIEAAERGRRRNVTFYVVDNAMELVERLRCLGIKVDITVKVKPGRILKLLDDNGMAFCLPHEAKHFGMAFLTEDDDLGIRGLMSFRNSRGGMSV